jgi:hypothetical protein
MKEDPIEKFKWPTLMKIMLSLSRKSKWRDRWDCIGHRLL